MLHFSIGNKKLVRFESIFSLPAGYTCPGAKDCLARANRNTGKITDGKDIEYRCYHASIEAIFPSLRNRVWSNLQMLRSKSVAEMTLLIETSLPKVFVHRIHSGGDYFSQDYFDAWLNVAKNNPHMLFYCYTKALPFVVARLNVIPTNFVITASRGGKFDYLIDDCNLREAVVVYSKNEAKKLGLKIDKDDSLAQNPNVKKFALLIHGNGPKGSKQSRAHYNKHHAKS